MNLGLRKGINKAIQKSVESNRIPVEQKAYLKTQKIEVWESIRMSTLYVSDLDGTLLRSNGRTSEYTNRVINRLTEKGMVFSIAKKAKKGKLMLDE